MKFIRFGGMTWPYDIETEELDSIEWQLRYGNPCKSELLLAASVMQAYCSLIHKTQKDRNYICKKIKEGLEND